MKKTFLLAAMILSGVMAFAQSEDPVIMTVAGQPVSRSEFEYSYNKNNAEGVIDKKSVKEYVDLFVNYKLKVQAALDEHLDTLSSFKEEFLGYRNQQVLPTFVSDDMMEQEARKIYDSTNEQIGPDGQAIASYILVSLSPNATPEEQNRQKARIDSIYTALLGGADFAEMARTHSDDKGAALRGGQMPPLTRSQLQEDFANRVFALKDGEMSTPFLLPMGYVIVKMHERKHLRPFEEELPDIKKWMENRNLRDAIADRRVKELAAEKLGMTGDMEKLDDKQKAEVAEEEKNLLEVRAAELSASDPDMKNLIREYYDGLLLYEISSRTVWDKAAKDEAGLQNFFKKNKKRYAWDKPRFKGIAYHVKNEADKKAVAQCVKGLPFDKWVAKLRTTFNSDSIIRIRVEKGIFKEGENAVIDKMVFKKDTVVKPVEGYPIDATYGKLLKKGPESYDDVRGLVTADYQEELEKAWVNELRKRYTVVVNEDVLDTVNKHN
ncbi:MAG: peptidylprolyl isomerase [Prevotella sp.]|uniref:foldase protein PrsA n=1 Tax=Prevotella sp. TaxID=59823 RepID=UPI002A33FA29|nr:peptidylprolyl isomerase [Prevotella sp.]MDD7317819.1 peptidylprolyl isomerase [Prevotellaceae bacterium]MDY4020734.1 peptidylprolyl isomerase [Prevotella sp.]